MRSWLSFLLCAACATAPQPVTAVPVIKVPVALAPVVAEPAAQPPDVPWAAPAPTVGRRPTTRPRTDGCLAESELVQLGEWGAWQLVKLEAELAKRGLVRLEAPRNGVSRGGRALAVRQYEGCGEQGMGAYAMDAQHRVHPLLVDFRVKRYTTVTICGCGARCGGQQMLFQEYVWAPQDATLGPAVSVVVALDEDVVTRQEYVCPPMP
jgi:hypothetical protein